MEDRGLRHYRNVIQDMVNTYNEIENNKDRYKAIALQNNTEGQSPSLYVSRVGNQLGGKKLRFPIHIYPKGKVFIHLENCGDLLGKGRIKKVSRILDADTLEVLANLLIPLTEDKIQISADKEVSIAQVFSGKRGLAQTIGRTQYLDNGVLTVALQQPLQDGSLKRIAQSGARFSRRDQFSIASDAIIGMTTLHAHGYAHLDIKPDNIHFKRTKDGTQAVLADYDTVSKTEELTQSDRLQGTRGYIAPEVLRSRITTGLTYPPGLELATAQKADVYSMGLSLFETYMNRRLRGNSNLARTYQRFKNLNGELFEEARRYRRASSQNEKRTIQRNTEAKIRNLKQAHNRLIDTLERLNFKSESEEKYLALLAAMMNPDAERRPNSTFVSQKINQIISQ